MFDLVIKVSEIEDVDSLLHRFHLEEGGLVQRVIDTACIRYCVPYTPFRTGSLAQSPYAATVAGSGEVVYPGPYAHYQYYGEVYGPNIPVEKDADGNVIQWRSPPGKGSKHPTGRPLKYSTDLNPLAGSFWFERMKADHVEDIKAEAMRAATGH